MSRATRTDAKSCQRPGDTDVPAHGLEVSPAKVLADRAFCQLGDKMAGAVGGDIRQQRSDSVVNRVENKVQRQDRRIGMRPDRPERSARPSFESRARAKPFGFRMRRFEFPPMAFWVVGPFQNPRPVLASSILALTIARLTLSDHIVLGACTCLYNCTGMRHSGRPHNGSREPRRTASFLASGSVGSTPVWRTWARMLVITILRVQEQVWARPSQIRAV
jgi:hypothetical protein